MKWLLAEKGEKKSVFAPASLSVLQAAPEMSHNVISIGLSGDF